MRARRFRDPNLARQPFENARPVVRLAVLLWTLVFVVGIAAAWFAWDIRRATGERQQTLDSLTAEAAAAHDAATRLHAELERADIEEQNERTGFLNERIAERAFSWNDLFDTLGEVLPRGVRVHDLSPLGFGAAARKSSTARKSAPSTTSLVTMSISGVAEDTESLLEFVDRLFAHPAFSEPNLASEATKGDEQIEFRLSVGFLPALATGAAPLAASATGAGGESAGGASRSAVAGRGAIAGGGLAAQAGGRAGGTVGEADPSAPGLSGPAATAGARLPPAEGPAGRAAIPGAMPRYTPGSNPAARESTSRYGSTPAGGEPGEPVDRRTTRETPNDRRTGTRPMRGTVSAPGAPGAPNLPAPLGPFASQAPRIR